MCSLTQVHRSQSLKKKIRRLVSLFYLARTFIQCTQRKPLMFCSCYGTASRMSLLDSGENENDDKLHRWEIEYESLMIEEKV